MTLFEEKVKKKATNSDEKRRRRKEKKLSRQVRQRESNHLPLDPNATYEYLSPEQTRTQQLAAKASILSCRHALRRT